MKLNNSRRFLLGLALAGASLFSQALAVDYYIQTASGSIDRYVVSTGDGSLFRTLGARAYCGYLYVTSLTDNRCVRPIARTIASPANIVVQATTTNQGGVYNFTLPDTETNNTTNLVPTPTYINTPVYVAPNTQSIISQVLSQLGTLVGIPGPKGDKGDKGDTGSAGTGSTVYSSSPSYYSNASVGGSYNGAVSPNPTYTTVNTNSLTSGTINTGSITTGNLTATGTTVLSTTTINGGLTLNPVATGTTGSPILVHDPVTGEIKQVDPSSLLASSTTNVINYTGDASNTLLSTVNGVVSSTTIGTLNNINLTGTTTSQNIVNSGNFLTNFLSAVTGYISNLIFDNATGTNITTSNLTATGTTNLATTTINGGLTTSGPNTLNGSTTVQDIIGTNATFTNLAAGTTTISGQLTATNTTLNGTTTFNGVVDLSNASVTMPSNATFTNIVWGNATGTNTYTQNLVADNATLSNASSTNFFSTVLNAITSYIQNLTADNANITNLVASTTQTNELTVTGSSTLASTTINGTLSLNPVASGSATSSLLVYGPNGEVQQVTPADMLASNTTNVINYTGDTSNTLESTVNGVLSTTTISTLNNINLTGTTTAATVTAQQLDTTGLTAVNATLTNATTSNLFATNASITNATTSNFFADVLSAITGYISNLFFENATGTNITATGTASLATIVAATTNTQILNASTTNTVDLSATNATITNLVTDTATFGPGTTTITGPLSLSSTTLNSMADNGLSAGADGKIEWGGVLHQNTLIDGVLNSFSVDFLNTKKFNVIDTTSLNLSSLFSAILTGHDVTIGVRDGAATGSLNLVTPNIYNVISSIGDIPVLQNLNGAIEYQSPASILASSTTHTIDYATSTELLTSIVNGVVATTSLLGSLNNWYSTVTNAPATSNTENIYQMANVGINNSNPLYTLDVNGMFDQSTTLLDGRNTSVHSGDNVIGAGIKGVGFTSQDATTSDLTYLFAGDALATGGYENQAAVGITNFGTGLNTQYLAGINGGNYFSHIQAQNTNYWTSTQWDQNGIRDNVNDSVLSSETVLRPGEYQVNSAEVVLSNYYNTRDDSGTTAPTNFLYTDSVGKVLSAPTTSLFGSIPVNNGLTNNAGTIQLGGTLIQDTIIDGQGFSLSLIKNRLLQLLGNFVEIGQDGGNTFNGAGYQVAIGNANTLNNDYNTAIGDRNTVGGDQSIVVGYENILDSNNNSYVVGFGNKSIVDSEDNYFMGESNDFSAAAGSHMNVFGSYNIGNDTTNNTTVVGLENTIDKTEYSTVVGRLNTVSGVTNSYLFGENLSASGDNVVELGTVDATKITLDATGRMYLRGALNVSTSDGNSGDILTSQGSTAMPVWSSPASILAGATTNTLTFATSTGLLTSTVNGIPATTTLLGMLCQNTLLGTFAFCNGGNTSGANTVLGTNDNFNLGFETNNVEKMTLFNLANPSIGIGRTSLTGVNGGASSYSGPTLFTGAAGNFSGNTGWDFIMDDDNNATNNQIRFRTNGDGASGTIDIMTVDEVSGGRVGIGTTAPGNKLEITHGTSGNSGLRFTNLTSSNSSATTSNKVLTVNSLGDVVLATVPGTENIVEFSVNANPNTAGTTFSPNQQNDPDVIYTSTIDNSTWKWNGSTYVTYIPTPTLCNIGSQFFCNNGNTTGANRILGTNDNFNLGFETNNVEKMTLFNLANPSIGIGRTSLTGVNGGASSYSGPTLFTGAAGNFSGNTGWDFIMDDDNNATNNQIRFRTNGDGASGTIDIMTVDEVSGGRVGIGTTAPGYKLDIYDASTAFAQTRVSGGGSGGGILTRLQNDGGKEYIIGVGGSNNNSLGTDAFFIRDGNSFANRFVIASSTGNVGIGNFASSMPTAQLHTTGSIRFQAFGAGTLTTDASGNVTVSSDERLKDIEGDFTRGLEDLKKIKPITYKWNDISGLEKENSYSGFSAQNVQSAIPEAISIDPRGYLSLQERPILATVVNAIKELADKIEKFANEFTSKKINTEELCIGATCLSEDDIKNIKNGTYQAPVSAPLTSDTGDTTTDSTTGGTLSCQAGTQYDSTTNSCVAIPVTDTTTTDTPVTDTPVEEPTTPVPEAPAPEPVADTTTDPAPATVDTTTTPTQ